MENLTKTVQNVSLRASPNFRILNIYDLKVELSVRKITPV